MHAHVPPYTVYSDCPNMYAYFCYTFCLCNIPMNTELLIPVYIVCHEHKVTFQCYSFATVSTPFVLSSLQAGVTHKMKEVHRKICDPAWN